MACRTCGGKKIENSKEFILDIIGKTMAFIVAVIALPFLFILLPVIIFRSIYYGKTDINILESYYKKNKLSNEKNITEQDIELLEVIEV
jgi:hypothetical protein